MPLSLILAVPNHVESPVFESSAVNSLEETLENAGVTEVSLEGTTNNPGNYGESIRLVIEGKLCTTVKVAIPFLYKANKEWKIPIRIDMYSTSKH